MVIVLLILMGAYVAVSLAYMNEKRRLALPANKQFWYPVAWDGRGYVDPSELIRVYPVAQPVRRGGGGYTSDGESELDSDDSLFDSEDED